MMFRKKNLDILTRYINMSNFTKISISIWPPKESINTNTFRQNIYPLLVTVTINKQYFTQEIISIFKTLNNI